MRTKLFVLASLLCAFAAHGKPTITIPPITNVQQSGATLHQRPTINFTGAGVTCVDNPGTNRTDCTVTGGGTGGGNVVQGTVNFNCVAGGTCDTATTNITGTTWVTSTSIIVCNVDATVGTAEHPAGNEDPIIEDLRVQPSALVPGTGFTITAYAPNSTFGHYIFNCIGV